MAEAFTAAEGPLARRLLLALEAGQAAGGERRGMESAALVVRRPGGGYGGNHDRLVDHAGDPIAALRGLYELHELYLGSTPRERWVPLDAALRAEIQARLAALGWDGTLRDWMGWENLEERWVGDDHVDPVVLDQLWTRAS